MDGCGVAAAGADRQRTATELRELRSTEMTSLSENTTASEPRSRRVEGLGSPEDYRLSTASSVSTTSTSTSSSFSSLQSLQFLLASSLSITSPPIPPRSPLRLQHTVKGVPGRPPRPPSLSESLAPIAELALEPSLDLYDPEMPLLHSRSFGSISGLLDQPLSAALSHSRRSTTPDKPLPLTPQPSLSTPSAEPEDEDDVTLLPDADPSDSMCTSTPNMTKREYALLELLASERTYSNDLIFLRDLHIPLASGQPTTFNLGPATPPGSSASSARTLSTASDASTASYLANGQAPMTREDVKIVFGNIEKLAAFSEELARQLESALGEVVEGNEGQDYVGRLFLDFIPQMQPIYKAYITKQANAVEHYNSLPRTPAFNAYLAQTQVLAQAYSNAWDLPSLLIKPVQRLLKYPLLLASIIAETPDSHRDKANLVEAHARVEEVARGVNEGRRQREVVRDVLASAAVIPTPQRGGGETIKAKKKGSLSVSVAASVNLGRMKSLRTAALKAKQGPDANAEAEAVKVLGETLKSYEPFMKQFAKEATKWGDTMGTFIGALDEWAQTFGRVIWMDPEDERSEAFDAFLALIKQNLLPLCEGLKEVIKEDLLRTIGSLADTMVAPVRLLEAMHTLEPLHYGLLNLNVAKSRPPPQLLEASQSYVALRAQLFAELPTYLTLLDKGMAACIVKFARIQGAFYTAVRDRWGDLWDALKVDEEANQGAEETLRVWWSRYAEVEVQFTGLNIVRRLEKKPTPEKQRAKPGKPYVNGGQTTAVVSSVLAALDPLSIAMPQPSPSEFTFPTTPAPASAKPRSVHSMHSMECEVGTVSPRKSQENLQSKKSGKHSKSRRTSSSSRTHSATSMLIEPLPPYVNYGVPALAALSPTSPKTPTPRMQSMPLSPPLKKSHSANKYLNLDDELTPTNGSLSVHSVSVPLQEDGRGRPSRKPSFRRRLTDTFKAHDTRHRRSPSLPDYTPSPSPNTATFAPPATSTRRRRSDEQIPAMYECRVIHLCEPPGGVEYRDLPFFTLVVDEVYEILQEAGHPSVHRDLPLYVDDGEDCLLLVRNDAGDVGWALASFMVPVD